MKVLMYLNESELAPKGGPYGVGYYYHTEIQKRGDDSISFLHIDNPYEGIRKKEKKLFSFLPSCIKELYRNLRNIKQRRALLYGRPPKSKIDFSSYDVVHFHETKDLYMERENLKNYKGIVLLTSHSPVPYGQEKCLDLPKIIYWAIPRMKEKYEELDRYAFERADYIIFPCPEAEEPYYGHWPYYKKIHEIKPNSFKYVLTGITPSFASREREDVLKELCISNDKFVISYVGRHNTIKGYDVLKEIGKTVLNDDNTYFIVAGKESPFKRLNHPHWKEIGWTDDPHSYIAASDMFLLPNKETYFDIVMIEILSLGKIVVASRTGGNKYFEKNGVEGVFLYDSIDEAVMLINKIKSMNKSDRLMLGKKNYEFYKNNLTISSMYESYKKTLAEIEKEHNRP